MFSGLKARNRAFTLIELLVVISIIALLIGILLPALGTARGVARSLVDQSQLRTLAQAQSFYGSSNEDHYACATTTGWAGSVGEVRRGGTNVIQTYTGSTTSVTPTQYFDFISPTLGEELSFSAIRANRMGDIFNDFADPAARAMSSVFPGSTAPDRADFDEVVATTGYRQISYLMPGAFSVWGTPATGSFVPGQGLSGGDEDRYRRLYNGGLPLTWKLGPATQVRTPRGFRNQFNRVGNASQKIIVADGTRFVDSDRTLDFDASPNTRTFGAFTSGTPQWTGNVAYGQDSSQMGASPLNQELSFRHPNKSLNAAFFDGHTENLTQKEVWTDMARWAPAGSVVVGSELGGLTEEAQDWVDERLKPGMLDGVSGFILP